MKRVLFFISALIGLWIVISCQKETVVERVEVQKGNIIREWERLMQLWGILATII